MSTATCGEFSVVVKACVPTEDYWHGVAGHVRREYVVNGAAGHGEPSEPFFVKDNAARLETFWPPVPTAPLLADLVRHGLRSRCVLRSRTFLDGIDTPAGEPLNGVGYSRGKDATALHTIHAGEHLVGAFIEQRFKRANVWIPLRDTGIDLLVSDRRNRKSIGLQVKYSKDFLVTHHGPEFQKNLRVCAWFKINAEKLRNSPADFWVFVLEGFASRTVDFVVVPRAELMKRLRAIHGSDSSIQSYLDVTEKKRCWETRGLNRGDRLRIALGDYQNPKRDFTRWLNNWSPVAALNR